MLAGDGWLPLEISLLHVVVGHLRGQILGRNSQRRQKVRQRAGLSDAELVFHGLCCVTAEERRIAFGADAAKAIVIHSALENIVG